MAEIAGSNIMVLGASGALGSLITGELIANGSRVMATSSSIESAEKVPTAANPRLLADFTNPDSISVLIDYLLETPVEIDGIVNATGVVAFGSFAELDDKTLERLFAVNVLGPIRLIKGLMPRLKESVERGKSPFVVNISGVVAESPMAGLAAYSSSKAAVYAFDQALARELRREGIRVLDARPGHTETGLATRAIAGVAPAFPQGMAPETVAARIVKAILEDEKDLPSSAF